MAFRRLTFVILLAIVAAGCAKNGSNTHDVFRPGAQRPSPDAAWPFWPRSMRIHPLTRLVEDEPSGERLIEARVEFTDQDGHTTRAYGFLRIELFDGDPAAAGAEPIMGWDVDLRSLSRNATQFDDVSRTYLARLDLKEVVLPAHAMLRAEFYSLDGTDLGLTVRLRR